jgi:Family of unknown function (DUF5995)
VVIEAIESGAIGKGGPDSGGVIEAVVGLQDGADTGARGHGAGPVGRLLTAVAAPDEAAEVDAEFRAALLGGLVRRYLRAVRSHARGSAAPRVWQIVLSRWEGGVRDPTRTALAGAHALVCYDLPPAVVSACTLLGRNPGPIEQAVVRAVTDRLARLANDTVATNTAAPDTRSCDDARGLALLLSSSECWRQAEHLWTLRGRPSETEKERAALDWRAALVARALLGNG